MDTKVKEFYNNSYHYEEDADRGMPKSRFNRFLSPLTLNSEDRYLYVGCGVGHTVL